jgi:hypothetical protein
MESATMDDVLPSSETMAEVTRPNWNAADRVTEACEAAKAANGQNHKHKEAVCEALRLTLGLIEDWRGDHRDELAVVLAKHAPSKGKDGKDKDDVLAFVKYIFAQHDKAGWTWHSNALKQAISDGRTSDNLKMYFTTTTPTGAAKKWSKEHRKPPKPPTRLEVAIPGKLVLPESVTIPPDGLRVLLIEKAGKPLLAIPQTRRKQATEPAAPH